MKQKYNGFTLIELMVSVALMLIIIGMTMVIFNSTSTTFTVAEAKVDIMQNARLALDTIAKDIANATNINGKLNPDPDDSDIKLLTLDIMTVTNWRENSDSKTGKALVHYTLDRENVKIFDDQRLYPLNRSILIYNETSKTYEAITNNNPSLAEYLVAPNTEPKEDDDHINAPFYFEYFIHPGSKSQNWNCDKNNQIKSETDDKKYFTFEEELPPLVRITITVTDEYMNACRTLSRMIWIPKGIRRTQHVTKTHK